MNKSEIESKAKQLNNDGVRELLATMVEDTIDEYKSSLRCGLFVGLKANQKKCESFLLSSFAEQIFMELGINMTGQEVIDTVRKEVGVA